MIILLTGKPGAGKTTLIERFLTQTANVSFWVVSKEMRDAAQMRIGFEAQTSTGVRGVFAHKQRIQSSEQVGSYYLDLAVIDQVFTDELEQTLERAPEFLVIDEIGSMSMRSQRFAQIIDRLFAGTIPLLATIKRDDPSLDRYKQHPRAVLFEIVPGRGEELLGALSQIFASMNLVTRLSSAQQRVVLQLLRSYACEHQFLQITKLFNHALRYVIERRFVPLSPTSWRVQGDHGAHVVELDDSKQFRCDCPLFHGKGKYEGIPGECSHIQTIKIAAAIS
jgi:nucleoside-triphosphatase